MPERGFLTDTWDDDWFQGLSRDQRYLFVYLWTNNHCNQAGAYHITLATIAFEARFSEEELPDLLRSLSPKVEWYPDQNYIWVKNFLKRQLKSPKFLIAAAKCLKGIKNNGLVKEFISYNEALGVSIPYSYGKDRVLVEYEYSTNPNADTDTDPDSSSRKGIGVVKGKGEPGVAEFVPPSESEIEESLSEGDREVVSVWRSVKGFDLPAGEAAALVAKLRTEFGELDILAESKAWAARKLSEPLTRRSRPSSQIWNWMRKAREFARERRADESGKRVKGARSASDFRGGKW